MKKLNKYESPEFEVIDYKREDVLLQSDPDNRHVDSYQSLLLS
jgi:hypothetical protein